MVAMFGWIIPEPLATPTTRAPPRRRASAVFIVRSVVRMASANGSTSSPRAATASGTPARTRSIGSLWPITPVDPVSTSCARASPRAPAVAAAKSSLSQTPSSPLAQLALPALTTSACTLCSRRRGHGCGPRTAP
jgi:hypothetical protein